MRQEAHVVFTDFWKYAIRQMWSDTYSQHILKQPLKTNIYHIQHKFTPNSHCQFG